MNDQASLSEQPVQACEIQGFGSSIVVASRVVSVFEKLCMGIEVTVFGPSRRRASTHRRGNRRLCCIYQIRSQRGFMCVSADIFMYVHALSVGLAHASTWVRPLSPATGMDSRRLYDPHCATVRALAAKTICSMGNIVAGTSIFRPCGRRSHTNVQAARPFHEQPGKGAEVLAPLASVPAVFVHLQATWRTSCWEIPLHRHRARYWIDRSGWSMPRKLGPSD